MIGRPEWFQRRKYGGWGISPKTWQGWLYTALLLIPFLLFQALPFWDDKTRIVVTIGWLAFVALDVTHIMLTLRRDERESKIEALAERNASWTMVLLIALGIVYEAIRSGLHHEIAIDPFLIAALFGGLIAKSISNIVLERRAL